VSQTSDPAAPIRVAIVGYGLGSAAFHAPFVWTIAGLELSAIVTRDAKRQEQVKRDYPGVALTHASGLRSHLYMSVVSAQLAPRFRLLGDTAAHTKWGLDVQEDDEAPPPVAIADAIAALEVIEAARASVEQTTVIRL
jgi:predicted dehydrogenase